MSGETQLNKEISDSETVINSALFSSGATAVNTEMFDGGDIPEGTLILGKYRVVEKMPQVTGEASLYVCEYEGEKYAAKIYRRESAVKPEVVSVLGKLSSKYIARLYEYGEYGGKPAEIMQYFRRGNIGGRRYSFEELKNVIIPSVNEGLRVLHEAGIIHKDLKPSNIMLNDDGKSVSIIDFGISSFEENGNTVIVTKTGMTPEYSAPESYRGLFLEESDYYSFGITLYELYFGTTPYKNLSAEQIAQYTSIQRIPFSGDIPQELKELISALTYYDITNRRNKKNPNRRWTYEEVKNWCKGKKQPVPGDGADVSGSKIPTYRFKERDYGSMPELVKAISVFWEDGKKQLFRGKLSGFFKNFDEKAAANCLSAEESAVKNEGSDDIIFFRLLYKLNPDMISFNWKGNVFETLPALGRDVLEVLYSGGSCKYYTDILENGVLSEYMNCIGSSAGEQKAAVKSLEKYYLSDKNDSRHRKISLYLMGYLLSGQKILRLNEKEFGSIRELTAYMSALLNDSYDLFEDFCSRLVGRNNVLDEQFESWLTALGKQSELNQWKARFA